jgi:hypothetical protein
MIEASTMKSCVEPRWREDGGGKREGLENPGIA